MSKQVQLILPWPPSVNTYWRSLVLPRKNKTTGKTKPSSVVLLSEDGRKYRELVAGCVLEQGARRHWLSGKLSVEIVALPPDRRARDLDNLPKGVLDSLKAVGIYRDDCDIDDLRITRAALKPGGELRITISEIPGQATHTGELFAEGARA